MDHSDAAQQLREAITARDADAVQRIVDLAGAHVVDDWDDLPMVCTAAYTGEVALVRPFLDAAPDVPPAPLGDLLFTASHDQSLPLVEFLLASALEKDHDPRIVHLLLQAGADPNTPRSDGWTPLMLAAQCAERDLVRTLLEAGADPHATKSGGWTAADMAEYRHRDAVIALLAEHGARPLSVEGAGDRTVALVSRIREFYRQKVPEATIGPIEPAAPEALAELERLIGAELPADYRQFLLHNDMRHSLPATSSAWESAPSRHGGPT